MWRITWRDLVFRRRRFILAGIATALAFAVALLMSGVAYRWSSDDATG